MIVNIKDADNEDLDRLLSSRSAGVRGGLGAGASDLRAPACNTQFVPSEWRSALDVDELALILPHALLSKKHLTP